MPYLELPPPDWLALLGGSETEARWIADRDRKFDLIAEKAERFLELSSELEDEGALFHASPEVLEEHPDAADWYISLAGFALNTVQYIREAPANYGLTRRARTVRDNLTAGRPLPTEERAAFSDWINAELTKLYSEDTRDLQFARAVAFGLLGARSLGQGQNIGGSDGVLLLKRQLVSAFEKRNRSIEVGTDQGFQPYVPQQKLHGCDHIRIDSRLLLDFGGGGNRPDLVIKDRDLVIAKGEVKARKDVSNIWESWMPQIVDHLRTWTQESPDAARLFFGTLVTEEMIEGTSHSGVHRSGFKSLHSNGLLSNAYNIAKIAAGERRSSQAFSALLDALEDRLSSG